MTDTRLPAGFPFEFPMPSASFRPRPQLLGEKAEHIRRTASIVSDITCMHGEMPVIERELKAITENGHAIRSFHFATNY